jgi:hypothetical protein
MWLHLFSSVSGQLLTNIEILATVELHNRIRFEQPSLSFVSLATAGSVHLFLEIGFSGSIIRLGKISGELIYYFASPLLFNSLTAGRGVENVITYG